MQVENVAVVYNQVEKRNVITFVFAINYKRLKHFVVFTDTVIGTYLRLVLAP